MTAEELKRKKELQEWKKEQTDHQFARFCFKKANNELKIEEQGEMEGLMRLEAISSYIINNEARFKGLYSSQSSYSNNDFTEHN